MKKNSLVISLLALMICSLVLVSTPQPSNAQGGTQVGGIIWDNTTWTKASSPYRLTSPIQIPANSTLTIEPGVTITYVGVANQYDSSQAMFLVQGAIIAQGTEDNKISFNGGGVYAFFKNGGNGPFNWVNQQTFTLTYCIFQNASSLFHLQGGSAYLTFRNSEVRNIATSSMLFQVESENYIENNVFIDSAGFSIWDWIESSSAPLTYYIRYNLVKGNTEYFLNTACCRANTQILSSYNSFVDSNHEVLRLGNTIMGTLGAKYVGLNAQNNYWGTTDIATINSRITDINDEMTSPGAIPILPILNAPDPNTPTCITATGMSGGSITPNGIIGIKYGSNQAFTITANSGYHVADVKVNGTSVGAVTTYTVQNIQGATNISAVFAADPTPTPTITPSPTSIVPEFSALIVIAGLVLVTALALVTKKGMAGKKLN